MGETDVLAEDQVKINRFSRLTHRLRDVESEIAQLKSRIQTCKDASEELEMYMDSDGIMLAVGESFFPVDESIAEEQLEKAKSLANEFLERLVVEEETLSTELATLRKFLYTKFGDSINLEDRQ